MAFSLSSLLGSLFKKTSDSVIGIDVGSSAIKVVQLKRKGGRAVLVTYGGIDLGPYAGLEAGRATSLPLERVIEALRDNIREANITSLDAGLAIPLSASLISVVEMPSLPEKRMQEMVPLEARRYIPVPISEVSLDWWVIPKEERLFTSPAGTQGKNTPEGKVDVLLVAILNEAVNKYQVISKELALQNVFFEIEIFSSIRAVLDQGIQPVMVLDMGAASTKLYLVEHGIVRDSHIINRGSQDITLALAQSLNVPVTRAEEIKRTVGISRVPEQKNVADTINLVLSYVFIEANRVLLSFEKKYNKSISKVVMTGGGAVMKGFADAAREHFRADVEAADPFAKTVAPAVLKEKVLKERGPEFAVALGIAMRKLNQME